MARSLQIQHEERASTSPLLTGLLVFAVAWLLFGVFMGADAAVESPAPAADAAVTR
jgi:hypothetical protein